MSIKPGRPKGVSEARQQLINAARRLFIALPYRKVSTRTIADECGVNAALIHYYFGGKAGLFEQMLRETLAPVNRFLSTLEQAEGKKVQDLESFMRTYYLAISPTPDLPKLIMQVMSEPAGAQRPIVERIMGDLIPRLQRHFFENPELLRNLHPGTDPRFAKLTVFSLMLFPFVVPESLLNLHGFTVTQPQLMAFMEHNIAVLQRGMIRSAFVQQGKNAT